MPVYLAAICTAFTRCPFPEERGKQAWKTTRACVVSKRQVGNDTGCFALCHKNSDSSQTSLSMMCVRWKGKGIDQSGRLLFCSIEKQHYFSPDEPLSFRIVIRSLKLLKNIESVLGPYCPFFIFSLSFSPVHPFVPKRGRFLSVSPDDELYLVPLPPRYTGPWLAFVRAQSACDLEEDNNGFHRFIISQTRDERGVLEILFPPWTRLFFVPRFSPAGRRAWKGRLEVVASFPPSPSVFLRETGMFARKDSVGERERRARGNSPGERGHDGTFTFSFFDSCHGSFSDFGSRDLFVPLSLSLCPQSLPNLSWEKYHVRGSRNFLAVETISVRHFFPDSGERSRDEGEKTLCKTVRLGVSGRRKLPFFPRATYGALSAARKWKDGGGEKNFQEKDHWAKYSLCADMVSNEH